MLVSGPVGTSVTGVAFASRAWAIQSIACVGSGSRAGGGRSGPSRPVSPCTSAATWRARISGRAAPAATVTSGRPTWSRTRIAFAVVFSSVWLPCVVVTPSSSTSGLASASSSAIASSWPGSQSRMIGIGAKAREYGLPAGGGEDLARDLTRRAGVVAHDRVLEPRLKPVSLGQVLRELATAVARAQPPLARGLRHLEADDEELDARQRRADRVEL